MKTIMTTLLLLLITFSSNAQFEERTTQLRLNTFTSPGSWDDGYSQGFQFNANFDFGLHVSPEFYYFPNLNGTDYLHFGVAIGYNIIHNNNFRIHSGIFGGGVKRNYKDIDSNEDYFETSPTNGTFGIDSGIEWQLGRSPFFVGTSGRFQYRTDPGNEDNYWRFNGYISIGIILN